MGGRVIEFDELRIKREGIREGKKDGADWAFHTVVESLICDGTEGEVISRATGYDRGRIDSIAKELNRTVEWNGAGN